jgi:hypothetical protein
MPIKQKDVGLAQMRRTNVWNVQYTGLFQAVYL